MTNKNLYRSVALPMVITPVSVPSPSPRTYRVRKGVLSVNFMRLRADVMLPNRALAN